MTTDEFSEYRKHIISELERLNTVYMSLDEKVDKLITSFEVMKVKLVFYGAAVAAMISVVSNLLLKGGSS